MRLESGGQIAVLAAQASSTSALEMAQDPAKSVFCAFGELLTVRMFRDGKGLELATLP
jgi:hypothetical protein